MKVLHDRLKSGPSNCGVRFCNKRGDEFRLVLDGLLKPEFMVQRDVAQYNLLLKSFRTPRFAVAMDITIPNRNIGGRSQNIFWVATQVLADHVSHTWGARAELGPTTGITIGADIFR